VGLSRHALAFLLATRQVGVRYTTTLTLGRQGIWADERVLSAAYVDVGNHIDIREARRLFEAGKGYAEPFLHVLGAERVDSLDASDWEGSTIVHDLNQPFPDEMKGRYSTVIDGGTLEHVFNFPTALRSALEAVSVGGHYIAFTPANNWFGHGFYQLSPELYYRVLSAENGYRLRCLLMRSLSSPSRWYQVFDPAVVGHRTSRLGVFPVELYVLAERTADKQVLAAFPQQSDYAAAWAGTTRDRTAPTLRRRLARKEPLFLKTIRFVLAPLILGDRAAFRAIRLTDFRSLVDQNQP
jgi:hypothetical protein